MQHYGRYILAAAVGLLLGKCVYDGYKNPHSVPSCKSIESYFVDDNRSTTDPEDSDNSSPIEPNYTFINYNHPKVKENIRNKIFQSGFLSALEKKCQDLDMHCMGLLSVMDFETRGTFSPSIKNPTGSATGLIQFTEDTAEQLGTSTRKLARMSQVQQLKYVKRYFILMRRYHSVDYSHPENIATAVFYPAAIDKSNSYIIARKGSKAYHQNANLDVNPHNHKITKREYVKPALSRGY